MTMDTMTVIVSNNDKTMTITSDELESNISISFLSWHIADLLAAWFAVNTSFWSNYSIQDRQVVNMLTNSHSRLLWNSLPDDLKNINLSLQTFTRHLKTLFFPHTSTFSAFEVSDKNVLYKFTVIIIITWQLNMTGHREWTNVNSVCVRMYCMTKMLKLFETMLLISEWL